MESNTKAAEKCYFAIMRIRQLIENLNFQPKQNQDEILSWTNILNLPHLHFFTEK